MTEWPLIVTVDSPAATKDLAGRLAGLCQSGDVLLLIGDLGAGKTAFAQGFAAALGVEGPVTSPTFALVRQYRCAEGKPVETLIHADVYRTGSLGEVAELALAELVEERAVALIEWGELAAPVVGDDVLEVTLELPEPADPKGVAHTADPVGVAHTADPVGANDTGSAEQRRISMRGRGRWSGRAADVAHALSVLASPAKPGAMS
jgi:tRNA threonylcarbamoyladenosine biosynthesis protein TsaE